MVAKHNVIQMEIEMYKGVEHLKYFHCKATMATSV